MNVQQKKQQSGFTIIEVVLVLAIAGLIFLMVFIALPALQRNQRDVQRKNDLGRVKTVIQGYMSSNRGNIPVQGNLGTFKTKYLTPSSEYADPQGGEYDILYKQDGGTPPIGQIYYATNRVCGEDGTFTSTDANQRDYALAITLESQQVPFCLGSK